MASQGLVPGSVIPIYSSDYKISKPKRWKRWVVQAAMKIAGRHTALPIRFQTDDQCWAYIVGWLSHWNRDEPGYYRFPRLSPFGIEYHRLHRWVLAQDVCDLLHRIGAIFISSRLNHVPIDTPLPIIGADLDHLLPIIGAADLYHDPLPIIEAELDDPLPIIGADLDDPLPIIEAEWDDLASRLLDYDSDDLSNISDPSPPPLPDPEPPFPVQEINWSKSYNYAIITLLGLLQTINKHSKYKRNHICDEPAVIFHVVRTVLDHPTSSTEEVGEEVRESPPEYDEQDVERIARVVHTSLLAMQNAFLPLYPSSPDETKDEEKDEEETALPSPDATEDEEKKEKESEEKHSSSDKAEDEETESPKAKPDEAGQDKAEGEQQKFTDEEEDRIARGSHRNWRNASRR